MDSNRLNPVEYSEDRKRGDLPHVRRAIETITGTRVSCARCRTRSATHLIDAYASPRAVCGGCAEVWAGMNPIERRKSRLTFTVERGR